MNAAGNVGGIVTSKVALTPRNQAAAASFGLNGSSIQKKDALSALFVVSLGATEGTPDSFTVDARLEDSADNSSFAAVSAVTGRTPSVAITQITAAAGRAFLEVDLRHVREYFRLSFTVAFVNGTSPKINMCAECVLLPMHQPPVHA